MFQSFFGKTINYSLKYSVAKLILEQPLGYAGSADNILGKILIKISPIIDPKIN